MKSPRSQANAMKINDLRHRASVESQQASLVESQHGGRGSDF